MNLPCTRRACLAAGAMAWALPPLAFAEPSASPKLVVLMLRGGLDGLSLLPPHGDRRYEQLRPSIALKLGPEAGTSALPLDDLFGLHPAASGLLTMWQQGLLAPIHACGLRLPNRSHFDAQAVIESGGPDGRVLGDGWMNRLAAALAASEGSAPGLQCLNVGSSSAASFAGDWPVAQLPLGTGVTAPMVLDGPSFSSAFVAQYEASTPLHRQAELALRNRHTLLALLKSTEPKPKPGVAAWVSPVADAARLGRLMAASPELRLGLMSIDGWDTHFGQGRGVAGPFGARVKLLADSLVALAEGLGPALASTLVVAISEFGRTAAENASRGTDHGHGSVALLLGGTVKGGKVHGPWPSLDASALTDGRDLAVTTDLRELLAHAVSRHLRLNDRALEAVFPRSRLPAHLDMVRG